MKKLIILFLIILLVIIFIFPQNFEGYKVFLWDNDGGLIFSNPDNPTQQIGYEYNLIKAFEDIGFSNEKGNLEVDTGIAGAQELLEGSYGTVFITTGHRPATEELISPEEFYILSAYMEMGGCVYLAGNNVTEYMHINDSSFCHSYFGMKLVDPGSSQNYYDTIRVDTTFEFMRPYKLVYPAGTEPDYGIDEMSKVDPADTFSHIVTVYDSKGKLYKSTSGCTTPYLPDKGAPHWKSYLSAVSTGAFASPHSNGNDLLLADSTENQLIRASYVRDIMRIFSMGRFLLINHSNDEILTAIPESFDRQEFNYDYITVSLGTPLPDYDSLSQYTVVILYTGLLKDSSIFVPGDTDNLMAYMDYGGNMVLTGENIAEAIGLPGEGEYTFLKYYFGVDYLESAIAANIHLADTSSIYRDTLPVFEVSTFNSPDLIMPLSSFTGTPTGAYVFHNSKASQYSGVTFEGNTHRSALFSFPMSYIVSENALDILVGATLDRLFDVDLGYDNVLASQDNVNYSRVGNGVSFNVTISNPATGYIVLNRNSDEMDRVYTNSENTKYKLSSSESSGFFTIDYNVNGRTLRSYVFNISAERSDADVYLMDNVLYIETTGDYSSVAVYDIAGNLRMESDLQSGCTMQFREFADFASGIYFIKLRGNSKNTVRRIMKY